MSDFLMLFNQDSAVMSALVTVSVIVLAIVIIAAWFVAMKLFIKAAKMKGHYLSGGTSPLWFVGIFATPILVGIYVAGLPDLTAEQTADGSMQGQYYDWSFQQPYDPYYDPGYQQPYAMPYSQPYSQPYSSMYSPMSTGPVSYPSYPPQHSSSRYSHRMW